MRFPGEAFFGHRWYKLCNCMLFRYLPLGTHYYDEPYCFVLKTLGTFKTSDLMSVNVNITVLNDMGISKDLGQKEFRVNTASSYLISGIINGAPSVTVSLSGSETSSQLVSSNDGSYSFSVAAGGNYTVTPRKDGYSFSPASQTFSNVTSNRTQNFTAEIVRYTISGTVSGADSVLLTLSNDSDEILLVNDGESYSFSVVHGSNFTITPSKTGYSFTPQSQTFNTVTTDIYLNFSAQIINSLSLSMSPSDGGTISPSVGTYSFNSEEIVNLVATPAFGFRFDGWTGAVAEADSPSTSVIVSGDMKVIANFVKMYSLSMAVNPAYGGTTSPSIGTVQYDANSTVMITAIPETGYHFVGWTGNVNDSTSALTSVTVNDNMIVTANFEVTSTNKYNLTMVVNHAEWGTVSPSVGTQKYYENDVVYITATPAAGFIFTGWTGIVADSTNASTTVTVIGNMTVAANFVRAFSLTMVVNPTDGGIITPTAGIHHYAEGEMVTITAEPATGYRFSGWSNNVAENSQLTTRVTVNSHTTVIANFVPINTYSLTMAVSPAGGGSVTPAVGTYPYTEGQTITVTAEPISGYRFVQWSFNVADASKMTTTVTVNGDMTVTAYFEEINICTLTMTDSPLGGGSTSPVAGTYQYDSGSILTINAIPAPGYRFTGWSGIVTNPSSSTTTVTVTGDMTITANFVRVSSLTMAVSSYGGGSTSPVAGTYQYDSGSILTINAIPAPGYRFTGWSGIVTNPSSSTTTVTVTGDMIVTANFEVIPPTLYTISGTVTGAAGVTVTLSGSASASQIVASSGESYSFTVTAGGTYFVTPSKSGYSFSPASKTFSNVTSNQTQNFTGSIDAEYTISGIVTNYDKSYYIIELYDMDKNESKNLSYQNGETYSFTVRGGGSYIVKPIRPGYVYYPSQGTISNISSNQTFNFEGQIDVGVTMVYIPSGSFDMFGPQRPTHRVNISAFQMSNTEITQEQYRNTVGNNPSYFTGNDNLPVENISWLEAARFCNHLTRSIHKLNV